MQARFAFFLKYLSTAVLMGQAGLLAQSGGRIPPSPGDPVAIACSNHTRNDSGMSALDAWMKGKELASIEGDGVLGIGNWGHTREALEWYCKASAAGNPVASYDIAEIFRKGYVVNSRARDGAGHYHDLRAGLRDCILLV